nr:MAG TPA: hypothetical protein [Caudoviricetes sp.]
MPRRVFRVVSALSGIVRLLLRLGGHGGHASLESTIGAVALDHADLLAGGSGDLIGAVPGSPALDALAGGRQDGVVRHLVLVAVAGGQRRGDGELGLAGGGGAGGAGDGQVVQAVFAVLQHLADRLLVVRQDELTGLACALERHTVKVFGFNGAGGVDAGECLAHAVDIDISHLAGLEQVIGHFLDEEALELHYAVLVDVGHGTLGGGGQSVVNDSVIQVCTHLCPLGAHGLDVVVILAQGIEEHQHIVVGVVQQRFAVTGILGDKLAVSVVECLGLRSGLQFQPVCDSGREVVVHRVPVDTLMEVPAPGVFCGGVGVDDLGAAAEAAGIAGASAERLGGGLIIAGAADTGDVRGLHVEGGLVLLDAVHGFDAAAEEVGKIALLLEYRLQQALEFQLIAAGRQVVVVASRKQLEVKFLSHLSAPLLIFRNALVDLGHGIAGVVYGLGGSAGGSLHFGALQLRLDDGHKAVDPLLGLLGVLPYHEVQNVLGGVHVVLLQQAGGRLTQLHPQGRTLQLRVLLLELLHLILVLLVCIHLRQLGGLLLGIFHCHFLFRFPLGEFLVDDGIDILVGVFLIACALLLGRRLAFGLFSSLRLCLGRRFFRKQLQVKPIFFHCFYLLKVFDHSSLGLPPVFSPSGLRRAVPGDHRLVRTGDKPPPPPARQQKRNRPAVAPAAIPHI